jgi:hypothetical protein
MKETSAGVASEAAKILADPSSSETVRSVAASALSQREEEERPTIRCKFFVAGKTEFPLPEGEGKGAHVTLYGVKDAIFGPATPSATLTMTIYNPAAAAALVAGEQYFVDIKPVGKAE